MEAGYDLLYGIAHGPSLLPGQAGEEQARARTDREELRAGRLSEEGSLQERESGHTEYSLAGYRAAICVRFIDESAWGERDSGLQVAPGATVPRASPNHDDVVARRNAKGRSWWIALDIDQIAVKVVYLDPTCP